MYVLWLIRFRDASNSPAKGGRMVAKGRSRTTRNRGVGVSPEVKAGDVARWVRASFQCGLTFLHSSAVEQGDASECAVCRLPDSVNGNSMLFCDGVDCSAGDYLMINW